MDDDTPANETETEREGEPVTEIRVEPLGVGGERFKATVGGVEIAAEHMKLVGTTVTFYTKNVSVARVETARPAGELPNLAMRARKHGEAATWRVDDAEHAHVDEGHEATEEAAERAGHEAVRNDERLRPGARR